MAITARELIEELKSLPPDAELDFRNLWVSGPKEMTLSGAKLEGDDNIATLEVKVMVHGGNVPGTPAPENNWVKLFVPINRATARRTVDQLACVIDGVW